MTSLTHYPIADVEALRAALVNQRLSSPEVPTPALVLDRAVVRRNCDLMLRTVAELGVQWRPHIKTHKTTELTQLQVGEDLSLPVRIVASTVAEIENLVPWLQECTKQGREVDVLYGFPLTPSAIPRLASIAREISPGTVGLFVDHPAHVAIIEAVDASTWPGKIPIFVNIDVGYHREGVPAESQQLAQIAEALRSSHRIVLHGVYTHAGQSYGTSSPSEALTHMRSELEGLQEGAVAFLQHINNTPSLTDRTTGSGKLILSLGATPTITSAQNLLDPTPEAQQYRAVLDRINQTFEIEFHAGVYPVLDMQQLATRARPPHSPNTQTGSLLSIADIGSRVLVEVASLYLDRGAQPEALIAAGVLALGREPCKSYPGWGIVSPWPASTTSSDTPPFYDPEGSRTGWIVGRVAQEHGILTCDGERDHVRELEVGQRLLVWPNHACIAGAQYACYLIVDSALDDPERIVDVWVRWRGW